MDLNSISIKQFRQKVLPHATCYRDDIIISNHVEALDPFRYPCRIFATLVFFCVDGEIDFSINLRRYRIGSDTVVVAFAGDIIQIHEVKALEAYAVLLSSDYLNDLQIDFRQRSAFYIDTRQNAIAGVPHAELVSIVPYYPLMRTNMESNRVESHEVLRGLVRAFSYTVISLMRIYRRSDDNTAAGAAPRGQQLFDKFMALLKLHYTAERSVGFYADRLCLTPNYLSGVVKEYSGKSVTEWINEYVTLEAKLMLKNTDLSVQ